MKDVRKFFRIFNPLPLRPHFMQPISTICPQNLAILKPPSPLSEDVLYVWSLSNLAVKMIHDQMYINMFC